MNALSLIPLVSLFCYGALFIVNIRSGIQTKVNRAFALYLFSMTLWSLGSLLAHIDQKNFDPVFWNRFMIFGSTAMPITFYAFVSIFLNKPRKPWLILGTLVYLVTQVANVSGWIVQAAYVEQGRLYNVYGPAVTIPSVSWVLFIGLAVLDLSHEYRAIKNVIFRNRIKYLQIVIVLIFIGSLTNSTPLGVYPVDIAFNTVSAGLIAYAILRYSLLEISTVFRKSLLYSAPAVLIGTGTFGVLYLAWRYNSIDSILHILIMSLLLTMLQIFIGQPFTDQVKQWVDRNLFREKYDLGQMLGRVSRSVASVLDIHQLMNMILGELTGTMHISRAVFFLKDEQNGEFVLSDAKRITIAKPLKLSMDHPVVSWLSQHDQNLHGMDIDIMPQFRSMSQQESQDLRNLGAVLFIAIKARGDLVGILAVGPKLSNKPYSLDDEHTLITLAIQSAIAIENARLYAVERRQAVRDPLTGLYNRRYMEETLVRELSRSRRKSSPLGFIMIDIDHFKSFNDTHGHKVGDAVLCEVGRLLKSSIRREDVACRFGGEEFILILPETPLEIVTQRAEDLRQQAKEIRLKHQDQLLREISLSLGVAVFPDHAGTADDLIRVADEALYRSKDHGRDCISIAGEECPDS